MDEDGINLRQYLSFETACDLAPVIATDGVEGTGGAAAFCLGRVLRPTVISHIQQAGVEMENIAQVINPDDYLETEFGREFTPERNKQAWALAYARLETELARAAAGARLYVVMGVQGAGKSRWVAENAERLGARAIVFDAALPARRHRQHLLALARQYAVPVIGVFVRASLEQALWRNARRALDKRVPEAALKSVFAMLEPPCEAEGFLRVESAGEGDLG
ncbi:AAA family ATPase [Pseudomonas chlororaphis]|uniref:AAA family ATPase n=1 Tax=Pseudomonas chlororaphis TaxID=587753 RepID=UPI001E449058|nr:AAA family ATPase [Pseudomonas chlororaphis]